MKKRVAAYPINDLFLERWSARALSSEPISDRDLMSLFEAARWAPSSYNNQPWFFIYAKQNSSSWDHLFNLIDPSNQVWAKNAPVLIVVGSSNIFELTKKPSRTHSFDTGAAWQNLALQASLKNIIAHGIEGFDYERARHELKIPSSYCIEMMIALGKLADPSILPPDLQKREEYSDRKPLEKFVFEGTFREKK